MRKAIIAGAAVAVTAVAAWMLLQPKVGPVDDPVPASSAKAIVTVSMPELTGKAALGAEAFASFCATCHGADAGGIDGKGPPLIHKIYEPGHHGDFAFVRAARQGVRSHHWRFGDMPPVEGISDHDIDAIIAFVRTVQQANGIN